jgi:pimeloyl-ACP methyl ester carboxylesterase
MQPAAPTTALGRARAAFHTTVSLPPTGEPHPPQDPTGAFLSVTYPSPVGPLPAYLTKDPKDGKRHPAIVWITGGDFTSIGDVWTPQRRDNDQSAASYRNAGIVTMFPSLRGGNDNPGRREAFYGEADDILAAADFLAKQPWVDPKRIYLGGHSTGGTIALLTAEQTPRFRAVFAFGPVAAAWVYGPDFVGIDLQKLPDRREDELRTPWRWLADVSRRTFVIEGTSGGNVDSLRFMAKHNKNPQIRFVEIPGATHFNALAAANDVIAQKILADGAGATSTIEVTAGEIIAKMK